MKHELEPMSESVRVAYEKSLGLHKFRVKRKKTKQQPFAKRHPEL